MTTVAGDVRPLRTILAWRGDKIARDFIRDQPNWIQVHTNPDIKKPHGWRDVADILRETVGNALKKENKQYKDVWTWFINKQSGEYDKTRIVVGLPHDGLPIYKRGGRYGKDAYMMNMQILNLMGVSNLPSHTHMVLGTLDTEDGEVVSTFV